MIELDKLPELDKVDYKPLYIQLGDLLADYIRAHELAPGIRFPSEKELMERFELSRATVRQALQRLETVGLVRKIRGKGTFLADTMQKKHIGDLFQSIEANLEQQGITVKNVLLENKDVYPPRKWANRLNLPDKNKARLIRRIKLLDDLPMGIELRLFPIEVAEHFSKADIENRSLFQIVNSIPGCSIYCIRYNIEAKKASVQEANEMKIPLETLLLVRKGVYKDVKGKPIMFSRLALAPVHVDLEYIFNKEGDDWKVSKAR